MAQTLRVSGRDRVLVFAPHPDDETIAAGGLLQYACARGARVRVVFATDGDNNPWAQRAVERRWRISAADRARFGARRRREALAALARLGVAAGNAEFLGYHDQGLTALLMDGGAAPCTRLARCMAKFRPTIVVAPSPADLHPDHSALGVLVDFALDRSALRRASVRLVQYLVHELRAGGAKRNARAATDRRLVVPLAYRERLRKRRAMFAHGTQLVLRRRMLLTRAAEPETFVLACDAASRDGSRHAGGAPDTADADGRLWLSLRRRVRLGACGPTTLLLAVDGRIPRRVQGRLGQRSRVAHLRDVATGAYAEATILVRSAAHRLELGMAASLFADARRAYVKLERRFGFFDEAGWQPVALRVGRAAAVERTRERRPAPRDAPAAGARR